jgi:hypothetical protein
LSARAKDRFQLFDQLVQGQPITPKNMILTYKRSWLLNVLLVLAACTGLHAQSQEPTPEVAPADQAPTPIPLESPMPEVAATPAQQIEVPSNPITDAARFLAGLPVAESSTLAGLTHTANWQAHASAMNSAFATLDSRQLSNIRIWRSDFLAPVSAGAKTCVYYFSGPDFLYADAFFPDCSTYILVGLESVDAIPDLRTVPAAALDYTLQNIQISLNTILQFSFFKTKDMREDFGRGELKGVLPILFVFLARTGKVIQSVDYVSLDRAGQITKPGGSPHGVKVAFVDPAAGAQKALYFFNTDLSDDGLKSNPAVLRFTEQQGQANCFLKAASYLMYEGHFDTVRSFLLGDSLTIVEDDSGIPIKYITPEKWTLRFFGSYTAPINLFKQYYQPELRQYYETSSPKTLTFSFGYQWNRHNSSLILAVRK